MCESAASPASRVLWIGNGRLVLPDRIVENGSVLVCDGRIVNVNFPCPADASPLDARGGYILPGFIDLHVHGGGGADFMDGDVESIHRAARARTARHNSALRHNDDLRGFAA